MQKTYGPLFVFATGLSTFGLKRCDRDRKRYWFCSGLHRKQCGPERDMGPDWSEITTLTIRGFVTVTHPASGALCSG